MPVHYLYIRVMRNLTLILLVTCITSYGQENLEKITDSLVTEGKRLYASEMASWYGTDLFLEKYKNTQNIGGYLSYTHNDKARCIFFSKGEAPKVIGTISFDSTYNVQTAQVDVTERDFIENERTLFLIRAAAFKIVNSDTLFKVYNNTNLNLVPLISNGQKKVYILTGAKENGVVIFGNDYLLTFDDNNKLAGKRKLHKSFIPIRYGANDKKNEQSIGAMHTHLPEMGEFMAPTDICTLMLYARYAKWKQHIVVSENYFSIWDCTNNHLVIVTKEAWDKMNKNQ
jgi:hypothetical protein